MPNKTLRVIDFETTGIPENGIEHSVVEAAFVDVDAEMKIIRPIDFSMIVAPTTEMDICALATHHISEDEAKCGVEWSFAQERLLSIDIDKIIFVAHNADFEKQFFDPEGYDWIDTYKVALKLYPDAPRHTNQVLKYYLGIEDAEHHHPPHRALPDCYVTAEILIEMLDFVSVEEMIEISKQPPYLTKINFGKHKGSRFEDLPQGYLSWLVRQDDMNEGVKAAANRVLQGDFL